MQYSKEDILNEMIRMEEHMASLYRVYADQFPQDRLFWDSIASEEDQHAITLRTGRLYLIFGVLPATVLFKEVEELKVTNKSLESMTRLFADKKISREEAYNFAVQMEKSVSEAFFQKLLRQPAANEVEKIWQQLNEDTLNHSERIKALLE